MPFITISEEKKMKNKFLNLPKESQAAHIQSVENSLGLVDIVLDCPTLS